MSVASLLAPVFGQTPPEEVLGFKPGEDFHLATYEQAMEYFDRLAGESDRMRMFDMGPTSAGRRMRYAVISAEDNMANLDRLREIAGSLSLARGVSAEQAEQLAEEGRAIVWIDGGLHASEVAPALVNIQLAYDLVTGEDRRTRLIRENVITLIVFANPDGMTLVADWYMGNVGTKYETSPLPVLYHKYVGHDNNRDSAIANIVENRNMNRATGREWFLNIHYNQHQSGPFPARIWVPPFGEPTNPNVHPLLIRWVNMIGTAMARGLEAADQPGAISRISYDPWYSGYLKSLVEGQNIPAVMSETQSYRYATPHFYTLNDFPEDHRDLVPGQFFPSPWLPGWWRIGDAIAYNLTTTKSVLELAAKFRFDMLWTKWKVASDHIERFSGEPPYGWILPASQRDPSTTALLLNRLMNSGIEVHRADSDFVHEGVRYGQGSHILPTSQPYGLYVKNLFERQEFPDLRNFPRLWQGVTRPLANNEDAPMRPYDGAGWTLPLQMGIDSRVLRTPLEVAMTRLDRAEPPPAGVSGEGPRLAFSHADNNGFLAANLLLGAGATLGMAAEPFAIGAATFPSGTFVAESGTVSEATALSIAAKTGVPMRRMTHEPRVRPISPPRTALYQSWVANMDAGWMTLLFEQYGFEYHSLRDPEVRAGQLRERFDVIILPDQGAGSIRNGHRRGTMPPNYVGGIGESGLENLKEFVREGGILICNRASSSLAIEAFDLPLKNVLEGVSADKFFSPGSILRMSYDTDHPLAFGMEANGMAYYGSGSQAYELAGDSEAGDSEEGLEVVDVSEATFRDPSITFVAEFPDESLLLSGWLVGDELIQGKSAVVDCVVGAGRVVLFGFNVHNRAQAYSTMKLLFNAIYYR